MGNLCIIPARGGSKRIPRKNIKEFMGKPMLSYSISTASKSGLFDEIMVSTEDEEISSVALRFGAKVPFRRTLASADDFATTSSVIEEVINNYKNTGQYFENICCLYPCTPLLSVEDIVNTYLILNDTCADSVIPVLAYDYPIQRALKCIDGKIQFFNPENVFTRTQDLEKSYHDAGQFYWIKTDVFMKNKNIFTNNSRMYELSPFDCQDIDNELDWQLAELKWKTKQQ